MLSKDIFFLQNMYLVNTNIYEVWKCQTPSKVDVFIKKAQVSKLVSCSSKCPLMTWVWKIRMERELNLFSKYTSILVHTYYLPGPGTDSVSELNFIRLPMRKGSANKNLSPIFIIEELSDTGKPLLICWKYFKKLMYVKIPYCKV